MSKRLDSITPELAEWVVSQRLFFVSTAPLSAQGHVNCSPKGGDCLRVLGPHRVAYADYTGSGVETIAHLRENGRIVLLFCAFEGPPKIVRFHGRGEVILPGNPDFEALATQFPANPGTRALIRVEVARVSTSCGYSVPLFEFQAPRESLDKWAAQKGPEKLAEYRAINNRVSLDGLPSLEGTTPLEEHV